MRGLTIGSWLNPEPKLDAGERIVWRSTGAFWPFPDRPFAGGTVYITTARLCFVPNRLRLATPGPRASREPYSWPLDQVVSLDTRDYGFKTYGRGGRRMVVTLTDGREAHFGFLPAQRLDERLAEVRGVLGSRR
jgi:hypothetical protein